VCDSFIFVFGLFDLVAGDGTQREELGRVPKSHPSPLPVAFAIAARAIRNGLFVKSPPMIKWSGLESYCSIKSWTAANKSGAAEINRAFAFLSSVCVIFLFLVWFGLVCAGDGTQRNG
jgi:hypothetical protein